VILYIETNRVATSFIARVTYLWVLSTRASGFMFWEESEACDSLPKVEIRWLNLVSELQLNGTKEACFLSGYRGKNVGYGRNLLQQHSFRE